MRGEHLATRGQHELRVVGSAQLTDPAVEELDCRGTAPTCARNVAMARSARRSSSVCHNAGSPYINAFVRASCATAALDEVARDRERRAREPDHGHVELAHRIFTVSSTYGMSSSGSSGRRRSRSAVERKGARSPGRTGGDVDAEPDRRDGYDDVAVQDRGVDAVAPHRLHRDLGRELRACEWRRGCCPRRGSRGTRGATVRPGA